MSFAAKALETRYRGHRFRSRLEARWAVAFDAARIDWDYEPEGFALDLVGPYLPDFWLPQVSMWAEVKPIAPNLVELQKARALSIGTGNPVLLLIGKPEGLAYYAIEEGDTEMTDVAYLEDGSAARVMDYAVFNDFYRSCGDGGFSFPMPTDTGFNPDFIEEGPAKAAASARFEHGESGAA